MSLFQYTAYQNTAPEIKRHIFKAVHMSARKLGGKNALQPHEADHSHQNIMETLDYPVSCNKGQSLQPC